MLRSLQAFLERRKRDAARADDTPPVSLREGFTQGPGEAAEPVAVPAGDDGRVTAQPPGPDPVRPFSVSVAPDGMTAWLHLAANPLPGRQVNPTLQQVEQGLAAAGVVAGIDRQSIRQALAGQAEAMVCVATGVLPVEGQPARIDLLAAGPADGDAAAPGTRVRPGQGLVRVTPPLEGQPGYDVYGRPLAPEPVHPLRLIGGPGVQLTSDRTEAIAERPGRPQLLQLPHEGILASVVTVHDPGAPLPASSSPHQFDGDVVLSGGVVPGVTVRATGWIWVTGRVHTATLESNEGIRVDGVVQTSRLRTVAARRGLQALRDLSLRIQGDLEGLKDAAAQVLGHPRYADLSRASTLAHLVQMLAENRYRQIRQWPDQCRQAMAELADLQPPVDLEAAIIAAHRQVYSGGIQSLSDLDQPGQALQVVQQWTVSHLSHMPHEAPIMAMAILGSEVQADGPVYVDGRGIERTAVRARQQVRVSTLRASSVQSNTAIEVDMVTSTGQGEAQLAVDPGGRIKVGLVTDRVTIRVGDWQRHLAVRIENLRVESEKSGQVRAWSGQQPLDL